MYDSTRTVAVLLAVMAVVGFGIAPMTAVASSSENADTAAQLDGLDGSDLSTQADEHGPFPEEICTDLLGMVHEEMPYDMIVWFDDLPSEAQPSVPGRDQLPEDVRPPGVPWDVITPGSVGGIVVGMAPNHCEIQDPNDPTFDPIQNDDDNVDPDANGDVQQGEDGEVLFIFNGTLDQTSEGPSVDGTLGLDLAEDGAIDPETTLNDGEKDYGVSPELQYWSDGTTYFETDVFVFGSRLGVVEDCTGPECTFSTRGLPNFVDYPSLPSHTDEEYDTGDGSDGDSGGADDGENGTDGGTGTDGNSTDGTDGAGGSGSGGDAGGADSTDDGEADDGTGDDGETGEGDADTSDDGTDGEGDETTGDDATDEAGDDTENQQQAAEDDDEDAQRAAAADGSGLGVVVAMVVFILGAVAIAPRD